MKIRMLESVMLMPEFRLVEVGTEVDLDPAVAAQFCEARLAVPVPTSETQQAVVTPPEVRGESKRRSSKETR